MIHPSFSTVIRITFDIANKQNHALVTPAHLLLALLQEESSRETLIACKVNLEEIRIRVGQVISEHHPSVSESGSVDRSSDLDRALQRLFIFSAENRREKTSVDLLLSFLQENENNPYREILEQAGLTEKSILNHLQELQRAPV